jgi:hypothetical protein
MRMQLATTAARVAAFVATLSMTTAPRGEVAQFHSRTSYYREGLPFGKMTVINPSTVLSVKPWESLGITGGWSADIVSGASIKTRNAARGQNPDAISSASVRDTRHVVNGGLTFARKLSTLQATYNYAFENDYRSHSIDVFGKTELLQKTMELSIAYSHNWDSVCDRIQLDPDPTRRLSLDTSEECFRASQRVTSRSIAIDAIQAGWTQAWSPTFATQSTFSIQLQNGFLSNPYREVNLGINSPAQEYAPGVRVRLAGGLRMNWYVKALKTALRIGGRLYRDTWDVRAVTADAELERYLFIDALRLRARGRFYTQGRAAFYSDDYLIEPRGVYFTGDRELSTMRSVLAGARIAYGPTATDGKYLGFLQKIEVSLGLDHIWFNYSDFTINGTPLSKNAWASSVGASFTF